MWPAFSSAQSTDTSHGKSSCCPRRQRILERRPARFDQVVRGCDRFAVTGNEHLKSQLNGAFDIASEKNERTRLHFAEKPGRRGLELFSGYTRDDELTKRIAFHRF